MSGSGSVVSSGACRRSRWKYCAAVVQLAMPHVGVGGGLQEALEPRARMLGPLPFVAVRQQQHQRRRQAPLGSARGDELVEDDLRAVDEVAVLRFPQHQARPAPGCCSRTRSRWRAFSVSGLLWISNDALRACGNACSGTYSLAVHGVVKHRVAMAEGAALDVFAGQPDRDAVGEDRARTPAPRPRPSPPSARPGCRASPCAARGRVRASCGP